MQKGLAAEGSSQRLVAGEGEVVGGKGGAQSIEEVERGAMEGHGRVPAGREEAMAQGLLPHGTGTRSEGAGSRDKS